MREPGSPCAPGGLPHHLGVQVERLAGELDLGRPGGLPVTYGRRQHVGHDGPSLDLLGELALAAICGYAGVQSLVSTISDYLAFASALLAGGTHHGERVLSPPSVMLMTSDQLTPAQKAVSGFTPGYFADFGWGFGMAVRTRRTHLGPSAGSYGWNGGYGTIWYNDPAEDMTAILMIQRAAGRPTLPIFLDFFTAAYQAIDD